MKNNTTFQPLERLQLKNAFFLKQVKSRVDKKTNEKMKKIKLIFEKI
jgi:hypothetical protein